MRVCVCIYIYTLCIRATSNPRIFFRGTRSLQKGLLFFFFFFFQRDQVSEQLTDAVARAELTHDYTSSADLTPPPVMHIYTALFSHGPICLKTHFYRFFSLLYCTHTYCPKNYSNLAGIVCGRIKSTWQLCLPRILCYTLKNLSLE